MLDLTFARIDELIGGELDTVFGIPIIVTPGAEQDSSLDLRFYYGKRAGCAGETRQGISATR
jgi:hypothetical protein